MKFTFSKKLAFFTLVGFFFFSSCSHSEKYPWTRAIPKKSAFIIIPAEGTDIQTAVQSKYISTLEQFGSPALQPIMKIDSAASKSLPLQGIDLFAGTRQKLRVLWYVKAPEDFEDTLSRRFTPSFLNSHYRFHNHKILTLHFKNQEIFVSRLHNLYLLSTSSRAVEQSILAYKGKKNRINLDDISISPASLIMNTSEIDNWFARIGKVKEQEHIKDLLSGASPVLFKLSSQKNKNIIEDVTGQVTLLPDKASQLVKAASNANKPLFLDQYVSSEAAGFAVLRAPAASFPKTLPDTTDADRYLMKHKKPYKKLASTLDSEFGMEMFANSGFQSTSEYLFLRKLKNSGDFEEQLSNLNKDSVITQVDSTTYYVQSNSLAALLASKLCGFKNFYLSNVDGVAVIAARKGLINKVDFDHEQHQTIQYEGYYQQMKSSLPAKVSGLLVAGPKLKSFLQPLVSNSKYVDQIFSDFKYFALTARLDSTKKHLTLSLASFNGKQPKRPYRENWMYSMSDVSLSGHPVFGNLGGSPNKEVVFATKDNKVFVLASDGTLVRQFDTNEDTPVGSPVIYDWFGTGHNVILIAAGNKIYGWNMNGDALPEFPISFKYKITSPLVVSDVNHDQSPDAIVATENRKLHIINGSGKHLSGWPVRTNVPIKAAPYVGYFQGQPAVVAFSGNAVNAWNTHGNSLHGFPLFAKAKLQGSPMKFKKAILGNGSDGLLYAAGKNIPFADSLNAYHRSDSSATNLMAIRISSQALHGTPAAYKDQILTSNRSGTLYLLDDAGHLQQTENIGTPLSSVWSPEIIDINGDRLPDITALAQNGRLYAWQIDGSKRLKALPKTKMTNIHIGDLQGDGLKEIVGLTSDGLECWTIYPR
jgi:hypothetical protein